MNNPVSHSIQLAKQYPVHEWKLESRYLLHSINSQRLTYKFDDIWIYISTVFKIKNLNIFQIKTSMLYISYMSKFSKNTYATYINIVFMTVARNLILPNDRDPSFSCFN